MANKSDPIDAQSQTVGRLAANIANLLRGKHKPTFMPHQDCGDCVVVINAEKVHFSGKKWRDKLYRWHSGYPGGLKQRRAFEMLERQPIKILQKAVLGMLKRNSLREKYIKTRLYVYSGPSHPHTAQLPMDVSPLPPMPRHNSANRHFGLHLYADPHSYQKSLAESTGPKKGGRKDRRVLRATRND